MSVSVSVSVCGGGGVGVGWVGGWVVVVVGIVVFASARWALSLGPCPLDPWPARLQLPLGIVGIFVYALIYLSITIKYLFLYLLHLFITSFV